MKQAAMTSSSKPTPAFGVAVLRRAAKTSPASAARTPMLTKVRKVSRSVLMPDSLAAYHGAPRHKPVKCDERSHNDKHVRQTAMRGDQVRKIEDDASQQDALAD